MLDSLNIKNFKNLDDLQINSLGRVNLFTGKNNTGKSTILEALSIYASKGEVELIFQLLNERGENYRSSDIDKNETETNIRALSSLFTNRKVGFNKQDFISIGAIEKTLFGSQTSSQKFISLRLVRYHDEIINDENDTSKGIRRKRTIFDDEAEKLLGDFDIGFEIRTSSSNYILPLNRERPYRMLPKSLFGSPENYQLIRTRNIDREINGKLWDNITLSEKESYVIDALRIIEPNVERIAFIEENPRERTAIIKLINNKNVVPLRSMGDGINRIFTIILALVNSDNGFLLMDEFENGLHYTVQKKLWEIVFNLSQTLNVQVFATTHSGDCIAGFEEVVNQSENFSLGKLIRLESKNGNIKQVEFEAGELKIAGQFNIETR
jgi:AAA15 family ATPase/GTPase